MIGISAVELSAEPGDTACHIEEVASGEPAMVSSRVQRLHKTKDGFVFPAEISSGVYALKDRKMVCAIIRDITERRRMEQALEESLHGLEIRVKERTDELVRANEELRLEIGQRKEAQEGLRETERRMQEEARRMEILKFANDVALKLMHELRNPLVTIGGFSRRISNGNYSEENLKEYARIILEGSMRLDDVLTEVLTHLRNAAEET